MSDDDEISKAALAAFETARRKLSEAINAFDRAEEHAFANDDYALASAGRTLSGDVDTLIQKYDEMLSPRAGHYRR